MTSNDTVFRRYWGYGCNCFHLSDRPMTDGLGLAVVDKLDDTCKKYKGSITIHDSYNMTHYLSHIKWIIEFKSISECLKCAAMEHGDDCVGELVKYKFQVVGDQVQCKNKANTCERSLCECDNLLGIYSNTFLTNTEHFNTEHFTTEHFSTNTCSCCWIMEHSISYILGQLGLQARMFPSKITWF